MKELMMPLFLTVRPFLWALKNNFLTEEVARLTRKIALFYSEDLRDKDFQPTLFKSGEDAILTKNDCASLIETNDNYKKHIKAASIPEGEFFETHRAHLLKKCDLFSSKIDKYNKEVNVSKS